MIPRHAVGLLCCALSLVGAAASTVGAVNTLGAISATSAVSAEVERRYDWAVTTLERLVNQNSGTLNVAGVTRVGAMMRAELEPLGFKVSWIPMDRVGRAGHLRAVHEGAKGYKRILLIGHLDTVFEPDSPFQRFERHGNQATGPGASDDKGGLVVMLCALHALRAAGLLDRANLEIVLTGDEEDAGRPAAVSRADLIAAGRRADAALDFEGLVIEQGRDMGSVARRSAFTYRITAHGRSAHSSGIFSPATGNGAVFELARIIDEFRTELPEPNLTFNIGLLAGGATAQYDRDPVHASATGKSNIVPGTAIATGDYRSLSSVQDARVRARMEAIVARHLAGTSAEISFNEGYPPMSPTAGNRALLARLNQVNRQLGLPEMPELNPLRRGAGDISFVARAVDSFAGLGTVSTGDHTPRETVDLHSILRQSKRAALLIGALSAEPTSTTSH